MTKKKTTTGHHNKKINFLRYILRRKQCAMLTLIEVALFVMLLSFCIGAYFGYQIFNDQRIEIDRENAVIDRFADNITFAHCKFIKVVDFNTQFCKNRVGVVAFAYRYHALEDDKDETCLDINEQIYCHEYLIKNKLANPYPLPSAPEYQNGCPGFGNTTLDDEKNNINNNNTQIYTKLVPRNLEKLNKTIVHVQELFIKCPKCIPGELNTDKTGKSCSRKIKTMEKGWPWFAENCKEGEIIECSTISKAFTDSTVSKVPPPAATTASSNSESGTARNMLNLLNEQKQQEMMLKDDF